MRNTSRRPWERLLLQAVLGALTVLSTTSPAVADPTLIYSTYLGGSRSDTGFAVAARRGSTYVAGLTHSLDYPTFTGITSKPWDEYTSDVFVTALSSSGTFLYSTYLPMGENNESLVGIGVGPDDSAYVAALAYYGGDSAVVVAKLEPWGSLVWIRETYGRFRAEGMTVDSQGNVYVTGHNNSEDENHDYMDRAFIWKLGPDGSTSYWAEIDGNGHDIGHDVAVDAAGNAYVAGLTSSTNLPKANQQAPGGANAFVTKLDPAGLILWSTYLGGSGGDSGEEIEVAADGSLILAGTTSSSNFPLLNAMQTGLRGPGDLFLVRMRSWGARISSTYLGGSGADAVEDLAVDAGSILLAVDTGADSPLQEPLDTACGSSFLAKLNAAASQVLDAACLGSSSVYGVAADSSGVSLTGAAGSDLPLVNALQPSPGGEGDAFATKLVLNHPPDCSAAAASPGTLWPADGTFDTVSIRGITDREGDPVTIVLTSIFQDEWLTYSGTPDATGLGTSRARLRAARLNGGNGRVYHLSFTATDPRGDACTGTVKVCVPIEQGGTCVDGGARVDSTRAY